MAQSVQFRFTTRDLSAGVRKKLLEDEKKAAYAMREIRNLLVLETKKRTPVREGHLTASITGDVVQLAKSWAATVYVPLNSPAARYAIWLHEGEYKLGDNSLAKQGKTGVTVGPKYITRAVEDNHQKILRLIQWVLKK